MYTAVPAPTLRTVRRPKAKWAPMVTATDRHFHEQQFQGAGERREEVLELRRLFGSPDYFVKPGP
ncbi:hypothetical protein AB0N62_18840 [Streptomyces sp. NPDC093982]|uniref:hypothetical protein n=1 Tax=Streptomyces sp. NPDC093982 TaxID=3155077 RepID=UPI00342CE367